MIEQSGNAADANRGPRREGFDDVVWFRMDIGRRQNADPRWLLPLLCRRGHITRGEIGAIRIGANETHFQVPRAVEARFRDALAKTAREGAEDESGIRIETAPEAPRETARRNARSGNDGPHPAPQGPASAPCRWWSCRWRQPRRRLAGQEGPARALLMQQPAVPTDLHDVIVLGGGAAG
jgi:ATP-dependent RNA helicase DeaD